MGFLWISLNPMSFTCGLTAAEATQGNNKVNFQVPESATTFVQCFDAIGWAAECHLACKN